MGEALFNSVLSVLQELGIDIGNCRGQCYDNASNMAGTYKGLQARIKKINPLAEWVPCAAHTLNLVRVNSVNCCQETAEFFNFVQSLFNFFSKSTSLWQTVTAGLQPNENNRIEKLKALSDTRWSAHSEATKALARNHANIQHSLQKITEDDNQNATTRNEAGALRKKMCKLETASVTCGVQFLCHMWCTILSRIHKVNTALQAIEIDLCNAVDLVRSLRDYVSVLSCQFDIFEGAAKNISPNVSQFYKADAQ